MPEARTNMVSPIGSPRTSSIDSSFLNSASPSGSSSSFAQQLADALGKYLDQTGAGSSLEIDIQPEPGQNSGASQFLVTVKNSSQNASGSQIDGTPAAVSPAPPVDSGAVAAPPAAASVAQSSTQAVATAPASQAAVSSPSSSSGNPGPAYVTVPFGNGYTTIPTLATVLAQQDAMMQSPFMTEAAILNQDAIAAQDQMAGQSVPNTNLNWNDLTQDQQMAYMYAVNYGLPQGQSMQAYLESNLGPAIMANAPASNPMLFGNVLSVS
jgi:hypothetical protein